MPFTTYSTNAQRIGKLKGEILAHAIPVEVLGLTGQHKKMPKGSSDTVVYRRWIPFGATSTNANTMNRPVVVANAHITSEGITPSADVLTPVDVQVTLQQYACLYAITDKAVDLYEDDMPAAMKEQTGERVGLLREMIRYGQLKGITNAFYAGGTSRATVNTTLSITLLRKVSRNLLSNHAKMITSILAPSPNIGTKAVEAGFLVFAHTDMEHDIRQITGFVHVSNYGQRKVMHEMELGSADRYRFIVSPELAPYADSGAAIGATGMTSTTGTLIDVYPVIVVGQDAWGDVALRGSDSISPTWLPPTQVDKNDPLGQRGYCGAKFYSAALVLNNGWCAVIEAGATSL